jgi:membrane protease subunit (stomatin/prohibitin family)
MKKILLCLGIFSVALPAFAQSGWSRAGAALGGAAQSSQDAYDRGVSQAAEQAYLLESARGAKLEADRLEAENYWKQILTTDWKQFGLASDESTTVAAVYQLTNDQQAIIVRAQHQGLKATVMDAITAYKNYNYQLADQLMVAGEILARTQNQKASTTSDAPQTTQVPLGNK